MNADISVRECLHQFIDDLDEKRLHAMHTLFQEEIELNSAIYDREFKVGLDQRIAAYRQGGKLVDPQEMRLRLEHLRKGKS